MVESPGDDHGSRTRVLETLAGLLGFHGLALPCLPDGSRPDVLRVDMVRRGLFVGDAKHTETPGSVSTALRFRRYMRWIRAHQNGSAAGIAIVVLCFRRRQDAAKWLALVQALGADAGAPNATRVWSEELTDECHFVVIEYGEMRARTPTAA